MSAARVEPLVAKVTQARTVLEATKVWFDGKAERDAAMRAEMFRLGATDEELKPLDDEMVLMATLSDQVAEALVANTPAEV